MTGKDAESILESINITCNKNAVPFDDEGPFVGSGIRLGTPALTTRGMKEKEMEQIAVLIDRALKSTPEERPQIKEDVLKLVTPFPLP
jgi:glycine hydroxymethyltransferase